MMTLTFMKGDQYTSRRAAVQRCHFPTWTSAPPKARCDCVRGPWPRRSHRTRNLRGADQSPPPPPWVPRAKRRDRGPIRFNPLLPV